MYINLITIDLCPGQGGGGVKPSGTLDISENGVYDVYSYASASVDVHPSASLSETYISNGSYNITGEFNGGVITVDVPAPQFITETLNVSVNGTYNPGQGVDGYSQVVVDVPQSVIGFTQKEITEVVQITDLNNDASYVNTYAFVNNRYLQTVSLPVCSSIGNNAFQNCSSLTQVSLPVCSFIGNNVFQSCSSLTQVSLPVCSYVGNYAFNNCSLLTQVSLPVCENINMAAFAYCYSLTQVSLPVCSSIGNNAFRNCISLSIITIGYSGVCNLNNSNAFSATPIASGTGSIYVPASLVDSYKSATNWTYYSDKIFGI